MSADGKRSFFGVTASAVRSVEEVSLLIMRYSTMKRILCLMMALVMLGATPVFAVDLEIEEFFSGSINEKPLYSAPVATLSETSWDVDAFKAYLREAMANMETEIQISQFNIHDPDSLKMSNSITQGFTHTADLTIESLR